MNSPDEILSPRELSKLWKLSRSWPYTAVKRGLFPHYKLGGKTLRFKRSDIEKFFEDCRIGGKDGSIT